MKNSLDRTIQTRSRQSETQQKFHRFEKQPWIVTDKGVYKKVMPYPFDPKVVAPESLDEATKQKLQLLEDELAEFIMNEPARTSFQR